MSPGTTRVKAVAMTAPGTMEMRSYPYPQGDRDSAILKVEMTGVCGTDKHIFKGEAGQIRGKSIFPYIGGHEVIGTIVEIGENAVHTMDFDRQPLKPGDRVALAVEVNCGTCWYCRHHYNNTTCENQVMAYGIHPNADTAPYLRGGFAEYMYIMPGTSLFKIPEDLPTDVAVFVEEFAVAYHSLARATQPFAAVKEGFGPGDSVAILGNGPLGLLHGIMSSVHGAGLRIATDLADLRLAKAKELYADVAINASQTSAEAESSASEGHYGRSRSGPGDRIGRRARGLHRGPGDGEEGRDCHRGRQLGGHGENRATERDEAYRVQKRTHPLGLSLRVQLAPRFEDSAAAEPELSVRLSDFAQDGSRRTGGQDGSRDETKRVRQGSGRASRELNDDKVNVIQPSKTRQAHESNVLSNAVPADLPDVHPAGRLRRRFSRHSSREAENCHQSSRP